MSSSSMPSSMHVATSWVIPEFQREQGVRERRERVAKQNEAEQASRRELQIAKKLLFTRLATPGKPWVALKGVRPFLFDSKQGPLDRSVSTRPPQLQVRHGGLLQAPPDLLPCDMQKLITDFSGVSGVRLRTWEKRKLLRQTRVEQAQVDNNFAAVTFPISDAYGRKVTSVEYADESGDSRGIDYGRMQVPITAEDPEVLVGDPSEEEEEEQVVQPKNKKQKVAAKKKAKAPPAKKRKIKAKKSVKETAAQRKKRLREIARAKAAAKKLSNGSARLKPAMSRQKQLDSIRDQLAMDEGDSEEEESSSEDEVVSSGDKGRRKRKRARQDSESESESGDNERFMLELSTDSDTRFEREVERLKTMDEEEQRELVKHATQTNRQRDASDSEHSSHATRSSRRVRKPSSKVVEARATQLFVKAAKTRKTTRRPKVYGPDGKLKRRRKKKKVGRPAAAKSTSSAATTESKNIERTVAATEDLEAMGAVSYSQQQPSGDSDSDEVEPQARAQAADESDGDGEARPNMTLDDLLAALG
jgi:hypothetical protein